jgi:hypothetical protein
MVNGGMVVVVGAAVVVVPLGGSVVVEPLAAEVVVVDLFATGFPLPQAANMRPAAAIASTTEAVVRRKRRRSSLFSTNPLPYARGRTPSTPQAKEFILWRVTAQPLSDFPNRCTSFLCSFLERVDIVVSRIGTDAIR